MSEIHTVSDFRHCILFNIYFVLFCRLDTSEISSKRALIQQQQQEFLPNISRLEICMFMHENSIDFVDQGNQQIAVVEFVLRKHNLVLEEINKDATTSLQTSV